LAIIIDWNHPDLPLKTFAAGNLGVIQPSWANSYLCVSYRYLGNDPLTPAERESIVRLWHHRLRDASILNADMLSVALKYLQLRIKVLGLKAKTAPEIWTVSDYFDSEASIQSDAFDKALSTLASRINTYGLHSTQVKEWLKGQDKVFGMDSRKKVSVPDPLPSGFDKIIQADRRYQIAAATFYKQNYAAARKLFQKIAEDRQSSWSEIAPYLVARCAAVDDHVPDNEKTSLIEAALKNEKNFQRRQDLLDLLGPCIYRNMSKSEVMARLVKSITASHTERFGRDVGDLTYLIDETNQEPDQDPKAADRNDKKQKEKSDFLEHDLVDWLDTVQRPYDDYNYYDEKEAKLAEAKNAVKASHAISQWRKSHSVAWLVAVMACNTLRPADIQDAFDEARKIPPRSPAYLTASFFVVDALMHAKKFDEARARVQSILANKDLPPSAKTLFKAQMMYLAANTAEFLNAAIMSLPGITEGYILLPDDWLKQEANASFKTEHDALDIPVAKEINRNLPLSEWLKLAKNGHVSADFHRSIVASTWLRAQLLDRPDFAAALSSDFIAAYPVCASLIKSYQSCASPDARRFALARLVLRNYGMTPYLYPGVPRQGSRFSDLNYYNLNFWLPLRPNGVPAKTPDDPDDAPWPSVANPGNCVIAKLMKEYYQKGLRPVLSKEQMAEIDREMVALWKNHPSRFLGEPVLTWARSHPEDPDLPELLYKVVRLPKWSGASDVGSKYSHQAYVVLHSKYPRSQWAAKATCWY
jgi:hypothetical protein